VTAGEVARTVARADTVRAKGPIPQIVSANPEMKSSLAKDGEHHGDDAEDHRGGLVPITPRDDEEYVYNSPSISADGEWVAYVRVHIRPKDPKGPRGSDVFLVRRNGTDRRRLTFGGIADSPAFSPDGKEVAFRRGTYETGWNLEIVDLSRARPSVTQLTHLTRPANLLIFDPAWVPR
jgi:hypothetical protein